MASLLDPNALARAGTLALRARTIVEGALSGLHRSPHHGSSVEFAEHKEYSPGDEIRHIDWKAYGKFDRYYVKRFEEETELTAYLLVDASGSMTYGSPAKLVYAAQLAAALAYLFIRQQDRVGLLAFGAGEAARWVPPRGRTSHLADVLGQLEAAIADAEAGAARRAAGAAGAALSAALERIAETTRRRRALVVVLSDGFDASGQAVAAMRRLRAQRHDVVFFQTLDRDELELPFEGLTQFESLEDERRLLADPRTIRADYLRELEAFLARTRRACEEGDVERWLIPTDQALEQTLLEFLVARARGKSGGRAA